MSVIINNYNYAHFLDQAIQSALDQTYKTVEVIIVDDGSTDNSRSVVDAYGSRIRSVFKTNGGQGSAYNAGFEVSQGELIHFLDSDDFLAPNALEEAVRFWEPGVAKVQFYLKVVQGVDGTPTNAIVPSCRLISGDLREVILREGNYMSPPSSGNLYSREALLQILPMPEKEWITEADLYCIFQSPFFGRVSSVPTALGFYRVHATNVNAKTTMTGPVLRGKLRDEARRETLLTRFCSEREIPYTPGAVSKHFAHHKIRLASLLVDPANHPFQHDRSLHLFGLTIRLCWRDSGLSIVQKVCFTAWLAALVGTPKPYRTRLLELGFAPVKRPMILQRLLAVRNSKSSSTR